jgi:hypothetical protein
MIKEIITFTYLTLFAYYGFGQKSSIGSNTKPNPKPSPIEQILISDDPKKYELNMSFDPDDCCGGVGNPDNEKNNSNYIENKEFI